MRVSVYDRNRNNPGRKPNYWIRYTVEGVRVYERAKPSRRASEEYAAQIRRMVEAGTWVHPRQRKRGRHLFENYALDVIDRRVQRGVLTADKDERGHVENHLIPMFEGLRVSDLTFRVIRDKFAELAAEGGLAGRTIRNVHSTLRAVLQEAVEDELIHHTPDPLTSVRGHLPAPADRDDQWRRLAVFSREEVAKLVGCLDIPIDRRALYATLFLTGARVGELLAAHVQDYDRDAAPLSSITYVAEKRGRGRGREVRIVPVHPDLAAWLGWWLDEGYLLVHGHAPQPGDLLFPTTGSRRRAQGKRTMSQSELYKNWTDRDLPAAHLRHRRIHDTRRTFISTTRSTRLDAGMVRSITHKAVADVVLDSYTTYEWEALCAEIRRVEWNLPGPRLPEAGPRETPTVGEG